MASGVAAAMLEYKKKNRRAKTYGVFEVDEMWVHKKRYHFRYPRV